MSCNLVKCQFTIVNMLTRNKGKNMDYTKKDISDIADKARQYQADKDAQAWLSTLLKPITKELPPIDYKPMTKKNKLT